MSAWECKAEDKKTHEPLSVLPLLSSLRSYFLHSMHYATWGQTDNRGEVHILKVSALRPGRVNEWVSSSVHGIG